MSHKISSALLSLAVLVSMLGMQCVICPAPAAQQHDCCKAPDNGNCHKPTPKTQCQTMTLEPQGYHKAPLSVGHLVAPVPVTAAVATPAEPDLEPAPAAAPPHLHAPPDLYLYNSTLLV